MKAIYLYHYIALLKSGTLKPDRQYLARLLSSDRYARAASFNPRVLRGVSAAYVNGVELAVVLTAALLASMLPVLLHCVIYTDSSLTQLPACASA